MFLVGLASFLIAHIFTTILFIHLMHFPLGISISQVALILLILFFAIFMWTFLNSSLAEFKIPVIFYMFFLILMGITGLLAKGHNLSIILGVCLFIVSDSMLAWQKFKNTFTGANYLIWITYYLAQIFIPFGILVDAGNL